MRTRIGRVVLMDAVISFEYDRSVGRNLMPQVSLNAPAPDFILRDFRGEAVRLADFRGRAHVLLVFNRGFA